MILRNIDMILKGHVVTSPITNHFFSCCIILFPAITNFHKLRGLKQHKFIILWLYRSEFWHRSHWAEVGVLAGLHFLLGALGEFPCLLHFTEVTCVPWLTAPSSFKANKSRASPSNIPSLWTPSTSLFHFLVPLWSPWAHPNNAGNHPIARSLT